MPLEFPPCGAWFVVFREASSAHPPRGGSNALHSVTLHEIAGPWQVTFDAKWGGPEAVTFEKLESWADRPEPGIRHYSGTAIYEKGNTLPL